MTETKEQSHEISFSTWCLDANESQGMVRELPSSNDITATEDTRE